MVFFFFFHQSPAQLCHNLSHNGLTHTATSYTEQCPTTERENQL